jgi:hypothetical protein
MKLLVIFSLLILSFSTTSFASVYIAASMSSLNQTDTGKDDTEKDLLLEGSGISAYVGYKFSFLSLEVFHKTVTADSSKDTFTFDYEDTILGMGARIYFLGFLNLKLGTMSHDAKGEFKNGSTIILNYESKSSSSYYGLGAQVGIGSLEVFGDVTAHSTTDDNVDDAGVAYQDLEIGIRYFF